VLYILGGLTGAGAILFAFGLRVVFYGGGDIGFAFLQSADEQAAEIEQHRATQRAQAQPEPAAQPDPQPAAPAASPAPDKASLTAVTASSHWTNFRGPDRDGHYRARGPEQAIGSALE